MQFLLDLIKKIRIRNNLIFNIIILRRLLMKFSKAKELIIENFKMTILYVGDNYKVPGSLEATIKLKWELHDELTSGLEKLLKQCGDDEETFNKQWFLNFCKDFRSFCRLIFLKNNTNVIKPLEPLIFDFLEYLDITILDYVNSISERPSFQKRPSSQGCYASESSQIFTQTNTIEKENFTQHHNNQSIYDASKFSLKFNEERDDLSFTIKIREKNTYNEEHFMQWIYDRTGYFGSQTIEEQKKLIRCLNLVFLDMVKIKKHYTTTYYSITIYQNKIFIEYGFANKSATENFFTYIKKLDQVVKNASSNVKKQHHSDSSFSISLDLKSFLRIVEHLRVEKNRLLSQPSANSQTSNQQQLTSNPSSYFNSNNSLAQTGHSFLSYRSINLQHSRTVGTNVFCNFSWNR